MKSAERNDGICGPRPRKEWRIIKIGKQQKRKRMVSLLVTVPLSFVARNQFEKVLIVENYFEFIPEALEIAHNVLTHARAEYHNNNVRAIDCNSIRHQSCVVRV